LLGAVTNGDRRDDRKADNPDMKKKRRENKNRI